MVDYTITVSDVDNKVLGYVAHDQKDWIDNCIAARMVAGKRDIIDALIKHCNENGVTIATGEDAQINQAFDLGVVKLAKDVSSEQADNT